jgi:regulator of cell morphogenesis and NO signaling
MEITPNMTIGEVVAQNYRAADVFMQNHIDFCCGGKKTLERACAERKMEVSNLIASLNDVLKSGADQSSEAISWPADFLASYIEQKHHKYVRDNVALLLELTERIAAVHGERHPELLVLKKQFALLGNDLLEHLLKEEMVLFPYVKALVSTGTGRLPSAAGPIRVMEHEHEYAVSLMENIRNITNNYTVPGDGCTKYRVTLEKLREFEQDLHQHIHLENNILFPKIIEAESKR